MVRVSARFRRSALRPAEIGDALADRLEIEAVLLEEIGMASPDARWDLLAAACRAAAAVMRKPQTLPAALRRSLDAQDPGLAPAPTAALPHDQVKARLRKR